MSAEHLISLYIHLNSNHVGHLVVCMKEVYVNEGVNESLLNEEAVNLWMMMKESYNDMAVSSYLMYRVLLLRRLYIEAQLQMGWLSVAKKQNEKEAEADSFLKVCSNSESYRILRKPIRW